MSAGLVMAGFIFTIARLLISQEASDEKTLGKGVDYAGWCL